MKPFDVEAAKVRLGLASQGGWGPDSKISKISSISTSPQDKSAAPEPKTSCVTDANPAKEDVSQPAPQGKAQASSPANVANLLTIEDFGVSMCYASSADDIREALASIANRDYNFVAIDIETAPSPDFVDIPGAGLDPYCSQIRLIQLYDGGDTVCVLDLLGHDHHELLREAPIFDRPLIAHNAVFELKFLMSLGIRPRFIGCTMLQANALDGSLPSLALLVERYMGQHLNKSLQASDWSRPKLTEEQLAYAALDAVITHHVANIQATQLRGRGLVPTYRRMVNAQSAIAGLELNGCPFDRDSHSVLVESLRAETEAARDALVSIMGGATNPNSTKQMGEWLSKYLDETELANWPRTPSGQLKTSSAVWKARADLPVHQAILRHKNAHKRLTAFGPNFQRHIHPVTGRVHPQFRLGGAASGRLTCSRPNVQQIPRDPDFRRLFAAPDGHILVVADYSQIELRVAALLSEDEAMLSAYRDGEDIHTKTAASVLGVSPEEVTRIQRQQAKALTFGTLYGSGARGLAQSARDSYGVEMTIAEAESFQMRFYEAYPRLRLWQQRISALSRHSGTVETPGGRKRDLRKGGKHWKYTEAVNTPCQAGAAEVMLEALAELDTRLQGTPAQLVNIIHDELVLECPESFADQATSILEEAMHRGFMTMFPGADYMLHDLVETGIGKTWQDAKS